MPTAPQMQYPSGYCTIERVFFVSYHCSFQDLCESEGIKKIRLTNAKTAIELNAQHRLAKRYKPLKVKVAQLNNR